MLLHNIKSTQIISIVLLSIFMTSIGVLSGVQAYSGTVYGRNDYVGYFDATTDYYGGYVLPVISSGDAIPSSVDTVAELMSLLKNYNNDGGQKTSGSAFIVNTMLGRDAPGVGGKSVSAADFDELEARLNDRQAAGKIDWSGNVTSPYNSYWQGSGSGSNPNDDAYYSKTRNEPGIKILDDSGSTVYKIIRRCANPIGNTAGLPEESMDWDVTPTSEVIGGATTKNPGETVSWKHKVKNNGPDRVDESIDYRGIKSNGWSGEDDYTSIEPKVLVKDGSVSYNTSAYTILSNDGGKSLCRYTEATPHASDDENLINSAKACVYVPYHYTLTPSVTLDKSIMEAGTSVSATSKINNSGPTRSAPVQWQLSKIIVKPKKSSPGGGSSISSTKPCDFYDTTSDTTCTVLSREDDSDSPANIPTGEDTKLLTPKESPYVDLATDLAVGTKICYALSVKPSSYSASNVEDSDWAHSEPACVLLGKQPKTQVWGGDLVSGDRVQTSRSVKVSGSFGTAGSTFGSWVEYAIFSRGSITGMASNSAFNSNNGLADDTGCNYSRLTFTGGTGSSCATKGSYSVVSMPDLEANFPDTNNNINVTSVAINSLSSGTYMRSGNLDLTQSELSPGKSVILKVSGTVTISGNQTYNLNNNGSGYTTISQLPQLVIIANKIIINSTVSQVDAWLVAKGTSGIIETCDVESSTYSLAPAFELDSSKCNVKLTVNGPVVANELWLRRTAGSDPQSASDDPAEVFNLRADTFLWASARSLIAGRIRTVYVTELPPRF